MAHSLSIVIEMAIKIENGDRMKTKAIAVVAPEKVDLVDVELPALGSGEVLVETAYSCVSPGTELRCMSGEGEAAEFPYVPGYAMAGRVVACGPNTSIHEGTAVFAGGTEKCSITTLWGAHLAHAVKSESALVPVPDGVSLLEAATAKIAAIPYHGARLCPDLKGKRVAVVGLGPIGQFSARIHQALGATVVGGDLQEDRVELLRACGATGVNTAKGIQEAFADSFPEGADIVVDATGVSALIPQLMGLAKEKPWGDTPVEGARYLIQGSYAAGIEIPYLDGFMKELSFYFPRDSQPSDLKVVMDLIASGKLQVEDVVSKVYRPEQTSEAFAALKTPCEIAGTVAFEWRGE